MPLDKGLKREACTVCKSYYEFTFLRRLPPPAHWENIQRPAISIISQKLLSRALLLSSQSPLLAGTEHFNIKEKPVLGLQILLQLLGGALPSDGSVEGHTELGRPSAVLHLKKVGQKVKAAAF